MRAAHSARVVLAALSAVVLLACGAGWVSMRGVVGGANIIDAATSATGEQNILLVGLDSRTDAHGNPLPADQLAALHAGSNTDGGDNTDTMIVIHVPADGGAATAFSIPRDSYVALAGGFGTHKINSAYAYGQNSARPSLVARGRQGPALDLAAGEAGARESIATVQALTGLAITHYAAINLAAFNAISTAAGGVQVCLAAPTRDSFSGADFPAGIQTLRGPAALAFVRQRHGLPGGDLDRIRRQQVFMAALSRKLLSAGTLTDPAALNGILQVVRNYVVLDQDWDLLSLAEQLHGLSAGAVTFRTVPTGSANLLTPADGTAVAIDPAQVRAFIQDTLHPPPLPAPTLPALPPRAPVNPDAHVDRVEVRNGSGRNGAAAKAMTALVRDGFSPGATGNTSTQLRTTVAYAPAEAADAAVAAAVLGPGTVLIPQDGLAPGRLRVAVGVDRPTGRDPVPAPGAPPPAPPPINADAIPCIN